MKDTASTAAKTDVSLKLREFIAQKILTEKQAVQDKVQKSVKGQVISGGRVSPDQLLELMLPKAVARCWGLQSGYQDRTL